MSSVLITFASCLCPFASSDGLNSVSPSKKRKLYDLSDGGSIYRVESERPDTLMSKEAYMGKDKKEDTVEHFYEKLLHLRGLMKTKSGAAIAEGRHKFMETYLKQLDLEVSGER